MEKRGRVRAYGKYYFIRMNGTVTAGHFASWGHLLESDKECNDQYG